MPKVLFAREPDYLALGRNGHSRAKGVEIVTFVGDEIHLYPINSRGGRTRCRIPVTREALPALIMELQRHV